MFDYIYVSNPSKMFRFLRRVFILLVLFLIIFFIFRFIKPEATSRFVDKVKAIPTSISSRFHREKKSTILINWDTTYSSWNFEIDENYNVDTDISANSNEANEWVNDSDLLRLEELNKEINAILESWNNENSNEEVEENNIVENIIEPEPDIIVEPEPDIVNNSESSSNLGEIIWEVINDWNENNQQESTTTSSQTNTNTVSNEPQWWDCGEWLTVQDCEQLRRDFWNYN